MQTRASLSERIRTWLRGAILDVLVVPGAPLVEADIAARYRSSRTPVREALLRLQDEGLVEIRPQRGTYVAQLDLAQVEEAQFVRQAVEGAVIRRVCTIGANVALSAELALVLRQHAQANARNDDSGTRAADTAFHRTLVLASGLPGVWDVVARAREMHARIRAIAVPELGSGARALAEHRAVVRALRAGDGDGAVRAMTRHLDRNLELARVIARQHPDYFTAEPGRSSDAEGWLPLDGGRRGAERSGASLA